LAAWVSRQSSVVPSREFLEEKLDEVKKQFLNGTIPLPSYWGGYALSPVTAEFWQGRPNRLHDRFRYSSLNGSWLIERLSP
jgi:pyridoxamine 5'-phosphate oxidase